VSMANSVLRCSKRSVAGVHTDAIPIPGEA
jgi:hypothetical protein